MGAIEVIAKQTTAFIEWVASELEGYSGFGGIEAARVMRGKRPLTSVKNTGVLLKKEAKNLSSAVRRTANPYLYLVAREVPTNFEPHF